MRKMIPLLALAALLLPACTTSPAANLQAPSRTIEQDGVRVTLRLDREQYAPGETIWAEVHVANISRHPVPWVAGGCSVPAWVSVMAPSLQGRGYEWADQLGGFKRDALASLPDLAKIPFLDKATFDAHQAGRAVYCTATVRQMALAPGGEMTAKFAWDGALPLPDGPRVPAGWSTIEATVPMGRIDAPAPVTVRLQVALEGGPDWLISPGEAVDAALHDTRFREQVALPAGSEPAAASVTFVDGQWQVRASKRGIVAVVDPVYGRLTALTESFGLSHP